MRSTGRPSLVRVDLVVSGRPEYFSYMAVLYQKKLVVLLKYVINYTHSSERKQLFPACNEDRALIVFQIFNKVRVIFEIRSYDR